MTLSIECPGVQRGRRMVLAPQDFVFSDGVTHLVGLNGAGKTTLFEFVLGLLEATSASSCMIEHAGGKAISSGSRNEFMGAIGYQPQHIPAPRGMRLDGFVEHAAWLKGLSAHSAKLACSRTLAQVGLNDRSRSKLSDLSGGMRRRAGLAAAIVHQPSVLLLDEPTAGLDPVERARFHELIRELAPQRTIIVSTHLIDDVVGLGGNIVGLMDGKLTVQGSAESHEDGVLVGEQLLTWYTGGAR